MLGEYYLFCPRPFWFAKSELLAEILHAEIKIVNQLLAKHADLHNLLDSPEATVPERAACFTLLAHHKLIEAVDETFVERYEESPSLDEVELSTLKRSSGLVATDAPDWVQGMVQVIEQLPTRICAALPEPLREQGFDHNNSEKMQAIESSLRTLNSVEAIQALTERVLAQQLKRLEGRWAASIFPVSSPQLVQQPSTTSVTSGGQTRRMNKREGWEQKLKLFSAIQNALNRNSSLQGIEFCAELDMRHAPPLFDWVKTGEWSTGLTWKEAWGDRRLRKKIRRARQEAMKRL